MITGTFASFVILSISPLPPRGTITSTCFSSAMRQPTAARSVGRDDLDARLRQSRCGQPFVDAGGDRLVARERLAPAAQDRRVAGLETKARGVRRDVRPRLVDDADHAERHAHVSDLNARGPGPEVADLADRVRQRCDLLEPCGHGFDRRRRQGQPVDECGVLSGRPGGRDIARIRRHQLRDVAADRRRHRVQRGVLRRCVGARDQTCGTARRGAYAGHVGGDIGERTQPGNDEIAHARIVALPLFRSRERADARVESIRTGSRSDSRRRFRSANGAAAPDPARAFAAGAPCRCADNGCARRAMAPIPRAAARDA